MRHAVFSLVALAALDLTACSAAPADGFDDGAPTRSSSGASSSSSSSKRDGEDAGIVTETLAPAPDAGPTKDGARKIFVTSATFGGDLIGEAIARKLLTARPTTNAENAATMLKSADLLCSLVADSAGLGRGWKGYLSTPAYKDVAAQRGIDRLTGNGPWVLLDGRTAFLTKSSFLVGPSVPVNVTETGGKLASGASGGNNGVWTTSDGNGNPVDIVHSCLYQSVSYGGAAPIRGTIGNAEMTGTQWQSYDSGVECSGQWHLYCVQEP